MSGARDPLSGRPRRTELLALALITAAGLLLRARALGNSLFGDELSTYSIVTGHGAGGILTALDGHSVDLTPPLSFELAWLAERFGDSRQLLRLFPLLAGTATIPLTWLVAERTVQRRGAGLLAAGLVAASPFLIFYGSEARAYSIVMFLALAAVAALLEALRTGRRWAWVAYAGLSCAAMYAHYTAVFVLAGAALWAIVTQRSRARAVLAANLAAAAGFAPWLPALIDNTHSFGTKVFALVDPFTLSSVLHDLGRWGLGHPYLPLSTTPGPVALVLIATGLVAAAAGALLAPRPGARPGTFEAHLWLVPLLAVITPAGLALYSALHESVWDPRNLIASWPWLALSVAALLTMPVQPLARAAATLVGAGVLLGAITTVGAAEQRPDYARAAAIVLSASRADPVAVVTAPTPGPLAAMDAALAYAGNAGRPLLRVGSVPLRRTLAAPPYAFLPATPTAVLAAATLAARGDGRAFVIAPGRASVAALEQGRVDPQRALGPEFGTGTAGRLLATVFGPLGSYLRALRGRFAPVRTVTVPGFMPVTVYVLQRH